ncbi:hypothetical protein NX059_000732 [Plenodomus lindquistii]|nr:hypothetical protein NX059_000732 [Plenodomus lindquistii]
MASIRLHAQFTLLTQFLLPFLTLAKSPQLCYYANDTLASEDIIPCYTSVTTDHYACCKVGDKCLRHNSCYSLDFGVTYQYGCTDLSFRDAHCPTKCNLDTEKSHWVGLVFCNGTNNLPDDTWVCHHPDNCGGRSDCGEGIWDPDIQRLEGTTCDNVDHEERYVAFKESSTLSDIAALPVRTELSSWWVVHADRTAVTKASAMSSGMSGLSLAPSSATMTGQAVSMTTSTNAISSTSTSTSTTLMSGETHPAATNEKTITLGLGIGLGIGIPILLSLIALIIFFVRRQRNKHKAGPAASPGSWDEYTSEKGEVYAHHAQQQSELDGTPIFESPVSPQLSELQGSSTLGSPCQSPFVSPETVQGEFGVGGGVGDQGWGARRVHEMAS